MISDTKIGIVGVGGTGSHMAEISVRMGFRKIVLVDGDKVEITNLNRQTLYDEEDVGIPKVKAAAGKMKKINGDVEIITHNTMINRENINDILGNVDVILDGTDSFGARGILNEFAIKNNKILIFAAVEGSSGMIKMIVPHKTACLSCFGYPTVGDSIPCAVNGLLPTSVQFLASLAVTLAIKAILGEVDQNLYFFDVWNLDISKIETKLNPHCPICGVRD